VRISHDHHGAIQPGREQPEEATQVVAKALFLKPDSNLFARQDGGGLLSVLKGRNLGDLQEARADVIVAIRAAWETIRKNQSEGKPSDETITSLDLIDLTAVQDTQTWLVKIRISLEDGNTFSVNFEG
jgi:hypothetical protein